MGAFEGSTVQDVDIATLTLKDIENKSIVALLTQARQHSGLAKDVIASRTGFKRIQIDEMLSGKNFPKGQSAKLLQEGKSKGYIYADEDPRYPSLLSLLGFQKELIPTLCGKVRKRQLPQYSEEPTPESSSEIRSINSARELTRLLIIGTIAPDILKAQSRHDPDTVLALADEALEQKGPLALHIIRWSRRVEQVLGTQLTVDQAAKILEIVSSSR